MTSLCKLDDETEKIWVISEAEHFAFKIMSHFGNKKVKQSLIEESNIYFMTIIFKLKQTKEMTGKKYTRLRDVRDTAIQIPDSQPVQY